jgi:hypothetical protein
VRVGYAEAMVAASAWKGRPRRYWQRHDPYAPPRRPLAGAALVAAVRKMALKYPDNVRLN